MNVYDFDKTIFYPDSTASFYRYCLRTIPGTLLPTLPKALAAGLGYRAGKTPAKELKQQLFSFLPKLSPTELDALVSDFWRENEGGIGAWYLKQRRPDDLIISASPRFLLAPICAKLGVSLIATEMDPRTGIISGENCHDYEKPRRFYKEFPGAEVECFYSDSLTDSPMAEIADTAFLVNKHRLSPWPDKK